MTELLSLEAQYEALDNKTKAVIEAVFINSYLVPENQYAKLNHLTENDRQSFPIAKPGELSISTVKVADYIVNGDTHMLTQEFLDDVDKHLKDAFSCGWLIENVVIETPKGKISTREMIVPPFMEIPDEVKPEEIRNRGTYYINRERVDFIRERTVNNPVIKAK